MSSLVYCLHPSSLTWATEGRHINPSSWIHPILYCTCPSISTICSYCYLSVKVFYSISSHCHLARVHSHTPSIWSHRGIKVVWPDFQPMRVPEEPVCFHLFRQNPFFTSLHLKSPDHSVCPVPFYLNFSFEDGDSYLQSNLPEQ